MSTQSGAQGNRLPVIAGNWKMFKTTQEARQFTQVLAAQVKSFGSSLPEIILCPPFTALSAVKEETERLNAPFQVAAQTMESRESGAFTGEISPLMLLDLDIKHVIIGHSERRQYYNETDDTVNAKTKAAFQHGICPIVCVGESLQERESQQTDIVIERQVKAALTGIENTNYSKLIFAYEPVWAIGTGKVCAADEANRVCGLIRKLLGQSGNTTRILYGGSVKPDNIKELMAASDIDGALVGGASLEPGSFAQLVEGALLVTA